MGSARRSGAFRALALAAALTFTLSACGPSESDGPAQNEDGLTTVRVGLAEPTFNTALINLVIDEDIDANHGLDMQPTRSGAGSTNQIAALRAGEYDFAGVGTATAADASPKAPDWSSSPEPADSSTTSSSTPTSPKDSTSPPTTR